MKSMHLFRLLLLLLCIMSIISCGDNDALKLQPSVNHLSLSGEGESRTITFNNDNWEITGIENVKGGAIYGDIYDNNNNLQKENVELKLKNSGHLKAVWLNKGFIISHTASQSLDIKVLENTSGDDFGFIIYVQSGEQTEKITIFQEQSSGYVFEKIEYALLPGTHIKTWNKGISFEFNYLTDIHDAIRYNPMMNEKDCLLFECSLPQAFTWMENGFVEVLVPSGVYKDELYYNSEKVPFQNSPINLPLTFSVAEYTINPPVGISKCHFEIEYEVFKASYKLYIKNKRNQSIKVFDGILTRKYPTGLFELIWDI